MTPHARFDDALPRFARTIRNRWGLDAVEANLFLRDASGHLTFILLNDNHSLEERQELSSMIALELDAYVDGSEFAVATPEDLFDDTLRNNPAALAVSLSTNIFTGSLRLVDRRIVGSDWLRTPVPEARPPIRFVFASLKGGVGRSTALCVVAAEFAKSGNRVLAIDMDLEAPGLGSFLLSEETLPEFGLLDYLVESEVGQPLDDTFFADMVSASWLGAGLGRVDVLPAIGRRSVDNPHNVLAKIARAYLADGAGGVASTFQDRITSLVASFSDPSRYDLILIDARAGLHETTAAALLGLGADVLLFGLDQSQTYEGYKLLFSHLATLPHASMMTWKERLSIIQGKSTGDSRRQAHFASRMRELINRWLDRPHFFDTSDVSALDDTFEVDWDDSTENSLLPIDEESEIPVIPIFENDRFRTFDPGSNRDVLSSELYSTPYAALLQAVRDRLIDDYQGEIR